MPCRSCSLWCRQFWLILLKNIILQVRRPIGTVFELLLPCLAVVVVIVLRFTLFQPSDRCFATFSTSPPLSNYRELTVYYTPNTTEASEVISRASAVLPNAVFLAANGEDAMLQEIANLDKQLHPLYAGLILPDDLEPTFEDISVTIRETHEVGRSNSWFTVRKAAIFSGFSPRRGSYYIQKGFVHLQNAVSIGLSLWKLNDTVAPPIVRMRLMAFPSYSSDIFLEGIVLALPALLVLGYLYSAGVFTQELVLEKESRLRESMKMMGLKSSALFSAWFVKQFLFLMITGLVVTLLIKFGGILPKSDFLILLIFIILFIISLISYAFFVSSFFSSSRLSLFSSFLIWFAILFPYLVMALSYNELHIGVKVGMCLFSNTCTGFAINFISSLEILGSGLSWSNAFTPQTPEDPFHLGVVFGMLLLDSLLYLMIAWYKEAVFPGKYGVPKPFYFPFQPSYWLGRPLRKNTVVPPVDNEFQMVSAVQDGFDFEPDPKNLKCGIKIANLTKVYKRCCKKENVAVNDLSLNMFEGQITALLGHNGAGKTTTMSVLTGLYTPTSGDAVINGYSILTDMDQIRKSLGLCPQHNILFDRLTVKEHLLLFGMLKGENGRALSQDVKQMIADLGLENKTNAAASQLSGGMKRKLSVAIALIGGSRFVILDEPTAGMDPYARRATWDLLSKYKRNRTILLTTHHMDEADILGDRIAIMAEGKLLTSGSSLFLKSRFGVGYHLTVVKGKAYNSEGIAQLVTSMVPGAQKSGEVAGELSFVLPSSSIQFYAELFDKLEANKESLGITSYGVSATSIEDVFLQLTEVSEEEEENVMSVDEDHLGASNPLTTAELQGVTGTSPREEAGRKKSHDDDDDSCDSSTKLTTATQITANSAGRHGSSRPDDRESFDGVLPHLRGKVLNTGLRLWAQQLWAMIVKRALNTFRNLGILFSQLVLPLLFVTLGLTFLKTLPSWLANDPPRSLTLPESSPYSVIKAFYGDFGGSSQAGDFLQFLDPSLLQVSSLLNITQGVNAIRDAVLTHNDSNLCCDYTQQFLDLYCLTINASVYFQQLNNCSRNPRFGYTSCLECLDRTFSNRDVPCYFRRPRQVDPPGSGPLGDVHSYVDEYFLRFGAGSAQHLREYVRHYQVGLSVEPAALPGGGTGDVYTVWYNNQNYHTCPSTLSAFHNSYLDFLSRAGGEGSTATSSASPTVTFVNHPLPRTQEGLLEQRDAEYAGFIISTTVVFGFSFLIAGFTLFLVHERATKAKHLQFVAGIHTSAFWLANLVWDLMTSLVVTVVSVALFAAFQIQQFSGENLAAVALLMLGLCWSGLPLSYCVSFLFNSQLLTFAVTVMGLYFGSMIMTVVVWQVGIDNPELADTLQYVFTPFPSFCFSKGLDNIFFNQLTKDICVVSNETLLACDLEGLKFVESVFSMDVLGVGINLCVLLSEGLLFSLLLLLMEKSCFCRLCGFGRCCVKSSLSPSTRDYEDEEDVGKERLRVANLHKRHSKDILIIDNLIKTYSRLCRGACCCRKSTAAVCGISVGIPHGECFGLLGVNGAGKTTAFKILTGDLTPTTGTAFIAGEDIMKNIKGAQQHLGYCPQFDALLERMTAEELLTMFCRLRGIPESKVPGVVQTEVRRLGLAKYAKKRCGTYSGGNKRKLSVSLALVGDAPVLLLDEPTSGMDPKARRQVWQVLSSAIAQGRSVVLCSHSMEECEALCTRLAIMVDGEFKCLGSVQHLKSKFGKGYILSVRRSDSDLKTRSSSTDDDLPILDISTSISEIWSETGNGDNNMLPRARIGETPQHPVTPPTKADSGIGRIFPKAEFKECHQQWSTYYIPSDGLSWSGIFRKLVENKEYLGIEDYSVSQTTLEQVFLEFASEQTTAAV